MLSLERSNDENSKRKTRNDNASRGYNVVPAGKKECLICGKTNHVPTITNKGNMIINYFSRENLTNMNHKARFEELKGKKVWLECLTPGLKAGDESHNRYKSELYILICDRHKNNPEIFNYLSNIKQFHVDNPGSYEA